MDFLRALELAVDVAKDDKSQLDEIYLYEIDSQIQVYLKDCEGSLQFDFDRDLSAQIFLADFLDKRLQGTSLSLKTIFSTKWEVRLRYTKHLIAKLAMLGKTSEVFIDYTPVGKGASNV